MSHGRFRSATGCASALRLTEGAAGSRWSLGLGGAIASIALLVFAAAAQGAPPRMDYGDAPDGAPARYKTGVMGHFPSLRATKLLRVQRHSNAPRHRRSGLRLGLLRDREYDSRQVDRERTDDGVSVDRVRSCGDSQLTVTVDTRRLPAKLLDWMVENERTFFLNVWFDWNRNGKWGDRNGCGKRVRGNEWGVVNQQIYPMAFAEDRVRAFTIPFKGGRLRGEFWMRATLTLAEPIKPNPITMRGGSTGKPYLYGETEDSRVWRAADNTVAFGDKRRKKKAPGRGLFRVGCMSNPAANVEHGKSVRVPFFIKDEGRGAIHGKMITPERVAGKFKVRVIRHSNQRGVPRGFFRGSGFKFTSLEKVHKLKNPAQRHVVHFVFWRGRFKQVLKCAVQVNHTEITEPGPEGEPKKGGGEGGAALKQQQEEEEKKQQEEEEKKQQEEKEQGEPVEGQAVYTQDSGNPNQFDIGVAFSQEVDGFKIELTGGPPPFIYEVKDLPEGVECEIDEEHEQWILCRGKLTGEGFSLFLDIAGMSPAEVAELEERLTLWAIQGGEEVGPFPFTMATGG